MCCRSGQLIGAKLYLFMFLALVLIFSFSSTVSAETRVIINSADWTDVYSGVIYANLRGQQSYFLTSTNHATILKYSLPKDLDGLEVVSSRTSPFVVGYKTILEADGYRNVNELRVSNGNLELAERLTDITKFIVIDPSYGYNSISVAPLAIQGRYYVLFANRRSINQVSDFLEGKSVTELIVYGQVDREVKEALAEYNPRTINTGDRFDNNIEIVKMYQDIYSRNFGAPRKQAILTNGEFIESSVVSGADPVLFIGFSNVPTQVREYIDSSDLEVGTLVGNELIGSATFIRRQTGLSVFVKFGQGSRTPSDTISKVEDLDRFPIPRYPLNLDIVSAVINTATGNLEITYQNKAQIGTYFKNLLLTLTQDEVGVTIPDEYEPIFIGPNEFKTVVYPLTDAEGNKIDVVGKNITLDITTIYGESPKALEQTLQKSMSVEKVSIIDGAEIEIIDVSFQKAGSKFLIKVKNIGLVDAYVSAELLELYINGEYIIFSSDEVQRVSPGDTIVIEVTTTLTEEDVPENPKITAKVYYGERESVLIKVKQVTVDFKYAAPDYMMYVLVALLLFLLILFFLRKKCKNCGHKNPIVRKTCKKCKQKL
ncbi:MAG: hypothetical protein ACP5N2_06215 [Candidatus Nanoarchaeia archaeon]